LQVAGYSYREIAAALQMTERTVERSSSGGARRFVGRTRSRRALTAASPPEGSKPILAIARGHHTLEGSCCKRLQFTQAGPYGNSPQFECIMQPSAMHRSPERF
jgi:hypothetical protein